MRTRLPIGKPGDHKLKVETVPTSVKMWPTPIYVRNLRTEPAWEEHNASLLRTVLQEERRDLDPLTFGVIGATKTSQAIMQWNLESVSWLKNHIADGLEAVSASVGANESESVGLQVAIEGWAVVYRAAASHRLHTHHGSAWSGVYYLSVGAETNSPGHLQFIDARAGAIARNRSEGIGQLTPTTGKLVLFPSWLPHSVKATADTDEERVCIAFNIGYVEGSCEQ